MNSTSGQLLKLLVARALPKSNRKPRTKRLAGFFLASGAAVIGGPVGQDYKQAWTADITRLWPMECYRQCCSSVP